MRQLVNVHRSSIGMLEMAKAFQSRLQHISIFFQA